MNEANDAFSEGNRFGLPSFAGEAPVLQFLLRNYVGEEFPRTWRNPIARALTE